MKGEVIRVLLVEDEPVMARLVQTHLDQVPGLVELVHVDRLSSAIHRLNSGDFDAVLLDLGLPDSVGLETFRMVRHVNTMVPVVVMTGVEVDDLAIQAVREGAEDYVFKGRMDGSQLLRSIRYAVERSGRRRIDDAAKAARHELGIARQIQQQLYPTGAPQIDGFELAGLSLPAGEVGGDYYDFISTCDGSVMVAVGDAAGHGLGPALLMAEMRATLRALACTMRSPDEIRGLADRLLSDGMAEDRFITLLLARLDSDRSLTYVSAGHPPGYVLDDRGGVRRELGATALPLGLEESGRVDPEQRIVLWPGESVFLYTDGLAEAHSPQGESFGLQRALAVVGRLPHAPAEDVLKALREQVRDHCAGRTPYDDLTAVLIRAV